MNIDVCTWHSGLSAEKLYGKTVVVMHVLRSVTSMIWAAKNGAQRIIPVQDAGAAVDMYGRLSIPDCILAGEQAGEPISGFALSNSPEEYTSERVGGKAIIISTSNGTAAFRSTSTAKNVILGAMINRTAVAKRILELGDDTLILCVGAGGEPAAEDLVGAGAVINSLMKLAKESNIEVTRTDISFICMMLYKDWKTHTLSLSGATAVKALLGRGCNRDLDFCFSADLTDAVPMYHDGIVGI